MNAVITSDILIGRSLEQIQKQLRSALHFLVQYESLMPLGAPLLDSSYEDIQFKKACVQSSLFQADAIVQSLKSIFFDFPVYSQLEAISLWTTEFNYSIGLFQSVTAFKANIQTLINSIASGEIIEPPAKLGGLTS